MQHKSFTVRNAVLIEQNEIWWPRKAHRAFGLGVPHHIVISSDCLKKFDFIRKTSVLFLQKCGRNGPIVHSIAKRATKVTLGLCHYESIVRKFIILIGVAVQFLVRPRFESM